MTSVILPPSIQTRLKIQRKFIHNKKDNQNQEGVYSKHTWKHFLPVKKSPLVLYSQIFPTGLFCASFLFPWKLLSLPSLPSASFLTYIYQPSQKRPSKSTEGKSPPSFLFVSLYKDNKKNLPPKKNFSGPKKRNLLSFIIFFPFVTNSPMEKIYVLSF